MASQRSICATARSLEPPTPGNTSSVPLCARFSSIGSGQRTRTGPNGAPPAATRSASASRRRSAAGRSKRKYRSSTMSASTPPKPAPRPRRAHPPRASSLAGFGARGGRRARTGLDQVLLLPLEDDGAVLGVEQAVFAPRVKHHLHRAVPPPIPPHSPRRPPLHREVLEARVVVPPQEHLLRPARPASAALQSRRAPRPAPRSAPARCRHSACGVAPGGRAGGRAGGTGVRAA
jgi:hypothetical protein